MVLFKPFMAALLSIMLSVPCLVNGYVIYW